ncbi:MAG: HAMP domain-containing protein [Lachnospiraceae bacterium]|nr:HAMP domain-containing protein [Lachnospiraceae bacterium]MBP3609648.1 HAMP domain-containing protein [Lachnospiraceae bacterium]
MKEETLKPKYNRLFIKTYTRFAAVITVFAVLLGVLYMRMYEEATVEQYEQQLIQKAQGISSRCSTYFKDKLSSEWWNYLQMFSELEGTEIWSISNPKALHPLGTDMSIGLDVSVLSQEYVEIAEQAFSSKIETRTKFSAYHECDVVTVGVPVQGINGEVAGAIILNAPVETQKEVVASSWSMILMSGMVALMISFVIAIPFARSLTQPITSMRSTALELASGNYGAETGIIRYDEIGELATTIDFLADKLAENEVERKNMEQMRLDFFANVSHELRTPITVVRGYTESLVDGVVVDEERRNQYYARMLSECQSMERLVGDLLLLSKMQNPDFAIEKEPVHLQQVFKDIRRTAWAIADERQIEIVMNQPEEPCMMMADYVRLRQMFVVIIDNAIKFSKDGSSVYITVECDENIRVSIRDEGVGISEEELPYIFEKFYKSKLRQNAKGSGLGLAIARQICLKHGGTIQVESFVGKGTTFHFTFPKMEEINT